MRFALSLLASTAFLAACATTESGDSSGEIDLASDARVGEAVDTVCFGPRITGFYSAGDQALVLRRTQGEAYLAVTGFCPNAPRVEAISLDGGDRCLSRGDELLVADTPFPTDNDLSDRSARCRVTGLYEWDESAAASPTSNETD